MIVVTKLGEVFGDEPILEKKLFQFSKILLHLLKSAPKDNN
jgi:hypothetical protein